MNQSNSWLAFGPIAMLWLIGCSPSPDRIYLEAERASVNHEYEKAIALFNQVAEEIDTATLYAKRANCHSRIGNLEQAILDYGQAIEKSRGSQELATNRALAQYYYRRGYAYQLNKREVEAIADYERTLEIEPKHLEAKNNLAWILATTSDAAIRDPFRAVTFAKSECERTNWRDAANLDTLAAAYAANGEFDMAVTTQAKAIEQNRVDSRRSDFTLRLELYRQKKAFYEP